MRQVVKRGRPPLGADQVDGKARQYCARYGVTPGPNGLPPFPSGQRETRQHREWLTVYKAHQRLARRTGGSEGSADCRMVEGSDPEASPDRSGPSCALCSRTFRPDEIVRYARAGRSELQLHPGCAELLRLAEDAGPDAVARLSSVLWPDRVS